MFLKPEERHLCQKGPGCCCTSCTGSVVCPCSKGGQPPPEPHWHSCTQQVQGTGPSPPLEFDSLFVECLCQAVDSRTRKRLSNGKEPRRAIRLVMAQEERLKSWVCSSQRWDDWVGSWWRLCFLRGAEWVQSQTLLRGAQKWGKEKTGHRLHEGRCWLETREKCLAHAGGQRLEEIVHWWCILPPWEYSGLGWTKLWSAWCRAVVSAALRMQMDEVVSWDLFQPELGCVIAWFSREA